MLGYHRHGDQLVCQCGASPRKHRLSILCLYVRTHGGVSLYVFFSGKSFFQPGHPHPGCCNFPYGPSTSGDPDIDLYDELRFHRPDT